MEISTLFQLFRLFFDSVLTFWDPGAGRPRELILNSVSNFGPEGPKNPSGGMEGSQPYVSELARSSIQCRKNPVSSNKPALIPLWPRRVAKLQNDKWYEKCKKMPRNVFEILLHVCLSPAKKGAALTKMA